MDLSNFELLVLPDAIPLDEALLEKLHAYLAQGGRLLLSGTSGIAPDANRALLPLGIEPEGWSPYTTTYFQWEGDGSLHVMYDRGVRARPAPGAQVLARVAEPYFERAWNHFSSHQQTPPDRLSPYAAAVIHGNVGYISYPVFGAFARHGNLPYRRLVQTVLDHLLPRPLARLDAPSGAEIVVNRQGTRWVVHLLYYPAERRAENLDLIEDMVPLTQVPFAIRLTTGPARVYLAPQGVNLPFEYRDGYAHVTLPELRGHAMVVLE